MNEDIICMILVTLPVLVFAASLRAVDEPLATGLAFLCGFSVGGFTVTLARRGEAEE